jgi:hypothetical protein
LTLALALVACGIDPNDPDIDTAAVSWALVAGGAPRTCADVGVDTVVVVSTLVLAPGQGCPAAVDARSGPCAFRDRFACSAGAGLTRALPVGTVALAAFAQAAGGAPRGETGTQVIEVSGKGRRFELAPFEIAISGP